MKRILTNKNFIKSAVGVIYRMHPYYKPNGIDEIIDAINKYMLDRCIYCDKEENYSQVEIEEDIVYDFVDKCLKGCQAFKNLNLSQAEIDKGISVDDEKRGKWIVSGTSDGSHLKKYYDFIDLDACIRNIVNEIFNEFIDDDIFMQRREIINIKKNAKFKDIIPPCLVTFEKHNGKGRPITQRVVFVDYVKDNTFIYHTYTGHAFETFDKKDSKIVDIMYFEWDEDDIKECNNEDTTEFACVQG